MECVLHMKGVVSAFSLFELIHSGKNIYCVVSIVTAQCTLCFGRWSVEAEIY